MTEPSHPLTPQQQSLASSLQAQTAVLLATLPAQANSAPLMLQVLPLTAPQVPKPAPPSPP